MITNTELKNTLKKEGKELSEQDLNTSETYLSSWEILNINTIKTKRHQTIAVKIRFQKLAIMEMMK